MREVTDIRINLSQMNNKIFEMRWHNAGYYLRNMPYTTSVIADVNGTADLTDTDKSSGSYFNWTADLITVTAYTYAHTWINESALE